MEPDLIQTELNDIVNSLRNIVFSASYPDFRITYVNQAIEILTGYPPEVFLENSETWLQVYHPEDLHTIEKMVQNLNQHGKGINIYRLLHKDGSVVWVKGETQVLYDELGNPRKVIGIVTDINEQIIANEKIKKTNNLLDSTDRLARVGAWEYDLESQKLYWSAVTKEIHEVDPDYEPDVQTAIHFYKEGENKEKVAKLFFDAMENGIPFDDEFILITAKKREVYVRSIGKAVIQNNKVISIIGIFQDIDTIKKNQVALVELAEENERIFEGTQSAMFIVEVMGQNEFRYSRTNRSHQIQTGVSLADIQGKTPQELVGEKTGSIIANNYKYAIDSGRTVSYQENLNLPAGNVWWYTQLTPSFKPGKTPIIIGASIDITALKSKEEELNKSLSVVNAQNSKLQNFTYIVSHNLRSHCSNIFLLTKLFKEEENSEEKEKFFELLQGATQNLLDTVNNLGDIISINSQFELNKSDINFNLVIKSVMSTLTANREHLEAEFFIDCPEALEVYANPAYFESIFLNLLSNALKYSDPARKPIIHVFAREEENQFVFQIKDNGLGIDLNRYAGKIFGMYKIFHKHPDARGMGLFLVKNQLEAMGGTISVDSKVGKGTTFTIFFPKKLVA